MASDRNSMSAILPARRCSIIRHAKSAYPAGVADLDRPLNGRGKRNLQTMARWLAQLPPLDWLWCSPAARTRATAAGLAQPDSELCVDERLYLSSPSTVLEVLAGTPPAMRHVGVVMHNPGATQLINQLANQRVTDNVPTLGIASFVLDDSADVDTGFDQLGPAHWRLDTYRYPKHPDLDGR